MPLLSYTVNVPAEFTERLKEEFTTAVNYGVASIASEWYYLLIRQQQRLQTEWRPLSAGYEKQKESAYKNGRIGYIDKLRRTGTMMDRYVKGIRLNASKTSVTIPYPTSYASIHQSLDYKYYRRFELGEFKETAVREMSKSIRKYVN